MMIANIPKIWYRKATKSWYVEIERKQIRLGTTKTEANAELMKVLHDHGRLDTETELHFLINLFWEWYKPRHAKSTIKGKQGVIKSLLKFFPNSLEASKVKPYHITKWLDGTGAKAASTIRERITFVSFIFSWGVRSGHIGENTIKDMDLPPEELSDDFLPPKRFTELLYMAQSKVLRDLMFFMLDTGARVQEVTRLRAKEYDSEKQRFVLSIKKSKGRKRQRVIFLTQLSNQLVKRLVEEYPKGPIFRNTHGGAWTADAIGQNVRVIRDRMGLEKLTATMLRHSFAHYRLTQGQDAATVSKLMGHVDTSMLMRRYSHIEGSDWLGEQARKIELP